jgi:hypothetical protein
MFWIGCFDQFSQVHPNDQFNFPANSIYLFLQCTTYSFSYPEPFLRAVRRGALAESKTGYHENMVKEYIRY